jgi:Uma2 family endonuclease
MADLQAHLGDIPAERIRLEPHPGTATEKDLLRVGAKEDRLCELIDGTLVEKTMGWHESRMAILIASWLRSFVDQHDLGVVLGTDATLRILPGQVRLPDACFVSWKRFPKKSLKDVPIPALIPDLAVEVLSKSNTKREMDRKLREYFEAGVRLVWYIDPRSHTAQVFTAVDQMTELAQDGFLDGGDVLPGFKLSLAELFAEADRTGPRK